MTSASPADRNRRRALALSVFVGFAALAPTGACNRTDTPDERFVPVGRGAGGGSGTATASGGATVTGGSVGTESGGSPNGQGGAVEGGAAGMTGTGDAGGPAGPDCGPAPVTVGAFTREALRGAAADCAAYHYCRFEGAATELASAVHTHAKAPDTRTLARAERAYREAMARWSRVELFQFGPVASKSLSAGKDSYQGQGLRELIYSWPTTARCRVEEQLASAAFASKGMDGVLISARGLFGLEYSLFYEGSDTICAPASPAAKTWLTLSEEDIAQRKSDYAVALADDIVAQARRVSSAWRADGGNFRDIFVSASGYPSDQEAMNVLGFAMIYVEREVKDWKLGIPAGYTLTHPVSGPEAPFLKLATANIRENLLGFQALFQGCGENGEGLGFDDWLTEVGHAELADDILVALVKAKVVADATPSLESASLAQVEALYRAIKGVTDLLKTDLFGSGSPLNLKLPAGVEGDTD